MSNRTVFLSSGHSNARRLNGTYIEPGAVSGKLIEGDLTVRYVNKLAVELRALGVNVVTDDPSNTLKHTLTYFRNKTTPNCVVVDVHLNSSANPASTGTETLIPANPTAFEVLLAKDMSDDTSQCLNIPLRGNYKGHKGVKTELESHHGRLGWMTLTGENILLELCFISNPNNMKSYFDNEDLLIKAHAQTIFKYTLK
jgi:N-acetylmuramoyl-L-alanine amidase